MGMRSTTQAFQFNVRSSSCSSSLPRPRSPFEGDRDSPQPAKLLLRPFGMMSWGENIVLSFIPSGPGTVVVTTARPRV